MLCVYMIWKMEYFTKNIMYCDIETWVYNDWLTKSDSAVKKLIQKNQILHQIKHVLQT